MPTSYDYYNAALYAIDRIAEGKLPTHALRDARLPWRKFNEMIEADTELAKLLDEATERGSDTLADLLLTLDSPDNPYFTTDPKAQKVISDNIKWVLSRRFNKKYGDKVEIKVEATVEHVIVSQLEGARQRAQTAALEQANEYIDVPYVMLPPPAPSRT
jgi:terminase small subunit-like protein